MGLGLAMRDALGSMPGTAACAMNSLLESVSGGGRTGVFEGVDGEEAEGGGGGDAEEVDGSDEFVGVLKAGEAGSCPGEGQAGAVGEATCEHGEQEEKQAAFVHVDEAEREGHGRIDGSEKERGEDIRGSRIENKPTKPHKPG